mgnify:CR=1 FL=1
MINPIKKLSSYVPEPLPVGMPQLERFCSDIIELAGNYADADSMKWAIASQIIHSSRSRLSKNHFVQTLRKAAANQVASAMFQEIKLKQEAAAKANQTQVAVTTPNETASGEILSDQKV